LYWLLASRASAINMVLNLQRFPVEGINYKVATIRIVLSSSSTRTPVLYWLASRASAINMVLNLQLFPVEGINLKVATISIVCTTVWCSSL
jgi:hypothetical protein